MSDEKVTFTGLTPESVGIVIANAEKALAMLKMFAALTPTSIDDTVLDAIAKTLAIVKPYAGEPWFVNLLDLVLTYLKVNGTQEVKDIVAKLETK